MDIWNALREQRLQRKREARAKQTSGTLAGIGPGGWNAGALAESQERAAAQHSDANAILYRLYTEDSFTLTAIVARHFDGFTIIHAQGYFRNATESAAVIEILGDKSDRATILALAEDIRMANEQHSVLVSSQVVDVHSVEEV